LEQGTLIGDSTSDSLVEGELGGEVEDKEVAVVFIILINKIDISKRRE
jgi:hypothetical protein